MAKKVIRLTEAKVTEIAIEVAKRMLKEGVWNDLNKTVQRHDIDDIDWSGYDNLDLDNDVEQCMYELNKIREDGDYINGNPEAFRHAWNYMIALSQHRFANEEEAESKLKSIQDFIKQYKETTGNY